VVVGNQSFPAMLPTWKTTVSILHMAKLFDFNGKNLNFLGHKFSSTDNYYKVQKDGHNN
jgi:hypothetical protein